jgi:TPR repeat protein
MNTWITVLVLAIPLAVAFIFLGQEDDGCMAPDAQHNMGEMYFNGQAVTRDYEEAYMWLSLASEDHGRVGKSAEAFRDRLFTTLTPEQIAQAEARAAAWAPVATP